MDETRPMTKRELKALRKTERYEQQRQGRGSNLVKWVIIALGSALFLAFFAFVVILIKQNKNKPIVMSSAGYVRGSASAKVTLVEFGDFQCPACRAAEPFVRFAMKDFNNDLKFVFKHFPLTSIHANAMLAARTAEAAGRQGKFWEFHDWLYDNQESWANLSGPSAREKIMEGAKSLGLDVEKFNKDIDSRELSDKILAQQNEGINLGVSATPTFFINNKKIENNPTSYEEFKKIVASEVDKVK